MRRPPLSLPDPRSTAITLMVASTAVVPVVDTIAKSLTAVASPFFLVAARYTIGAALAVLVFRAPGRAWSAFRRSPRLHVARSTTLVAAMICFYGALSTLPVATALGGFFVGPVVAALLSAMVLRERPSVATGVAVAIGFAGAMLILRPEGGAAAGSAALALCSGGLSGVYLILTRAASISIRSEDNLVIQSVIGAGLVLPIAAVDLPRLSWGHLGLLAVMGLLSFVAHGLFLTAFRTLDVNSLAPLAYLEIAVAAVLGWVVFGRLPTAVTWAGIACIIAAGLLVSISRPEPRVRPDSLAGRRGPRVRVGVQASPPP